MSKLTATKFLATETKGDVSALYQSVSNPRAIFVLAHGAGANIEHSHMTSLADTLASINIETFRFNFPYMEAGGGRTDGLPVCIETIGHALQAVRRLRRDLPIYLSGHSFGGRMSSHFAADTQPDISGLVYFSFPLHGSKKPDTKRAAHLDTISVPQLFLSGDRDTLADLSLLTPIVKALPKATLHILSTADHGYKILKRQRKDDVYLEVANVVQQFVSNETDE